MNGRSVRSMCPVPMLTCRAACAAAKVSAGKVSGIDSSRLICSIPASMSCDLAAAVRITAR